MGISNFPAALQPIIQQGFLEREFQQALRSRLGYRAWQIGKISRWVSVKR